MNTAATLRLAFLADPNEVLAQEWMSFFADRGHDITVITRHDAEIRDGLDTRIKVVRMRPYKGAIGGRISIVGARRALNESLDIVRPDLVHVHDLTTGFGWMVRVSGFRPYVLTVWGSDIYLAVSRSRASRLIGRLTLQGAALTTMETRDLQSAAVRAGAEPDRVRMIQFGVDTKLFTPGDDDPELRQRLDLIGRRVVFAPRQIAPLYDHMTLVRALAGMADDVVVLMSAKNAHATYQRALEAEARDLGLADRLMILPRIERVDMPRMYRLASVVVSIPHSDSISVSVLEAMACGRPIVATDLPSPREWLWEVSPDLMVPDSDPERVRHALESALTMTPAERARRAAQMRGIAVDRADRTSNLIQMEGLYRDVLRTGHRSALVAGSGAE